MTEKKKVRTRKMQLHLNKPLLLQVKAPEALTQGIKAQGHIAYVT